MDDYKAMLRQGVLDNPTFVRLTLGGQVRGATVPWRRIVVRPVELRGQRYLQFSYFDARQDTTKNYRGAEAAAKLDEALDIPFSAITLHATDQEVQVQLSKKGKVLVHRRATAAHDVAPTLSHDRSKEMALPEDEPSPFLQAVGILNAQGEVRPRMRGKFAQINEFLKLLAHTGELERFDHSPIRVLDAGCGSAYLTFALYHYLNERRAIPATVIGIDTREELVRRSAEESARLGCGDRLCFAPSAIIAFEPHEAPDIVLALHACDTATDEAIAQGIRWGSRLIVSVPCCHHDLQEQTTAEVFRPIMRHGILKQRMGDILTDAFRALILRIMGYRTDVIEFVSSEHTSKNIMIRAVRAPARGDAEFVREYQALKAFWHVTPHLETLLGDALARFL